MSSRGQQGLPELFRKPNTVLSNVGFVLGLLWVIRTSTICLCGWMNACLSSSKVKPHWAEGSRAKCEKTRPPFLWADTRSPSRSLWGNPNQAITTKRESSCTKMLEEQEGDAHQPSQQLFFFFRAPPCPRLLMLVLVYKANINRLS